MVYKIYFADMGKATGNKEIGKRPVVVIDRNKNTGEVTLLKITSRMRTTPAHVRMNNYLIHGFCNTREIFVIDNKYLGRIVRECTTSEEIAIKTTMARVGARVVSGRD